jgi:hypothetical protein
VYDLIREIMVWRPEYPDWRRADDLRNAYRTLRESEHTLVVSIRWIIALVNIIALEMLVRLAKPRPAGTGIFEAARRTVQLLRAPRPLPVSRIVPGLPMTGLMGRGRHRRFAVHSHAAAWVFALGTGIGLVILMLLDDRTLSHTKVSAVLVMLSLLPGVVVAAGWRERWASLGYESLLPSGRDQFVKEIAIALATDLAEFWIAAFVTELAVLCFFTPKELTTGAFVLSAVCSAMMQVLWLGAIFLTSRFRQLVPYVVVLLGTALFTVIPILQVWSDPRITKLPFLVSIALTEMTFGGVLLLAGLGLWRKADLA